MDEACFGLYTIDKIFDCVVRINGSTRTLQYTYEISGVKPDIYYQPQNSSLYVFDTTQILNINGGIITPLDLNLTLSVFQH